MKKVLQPREGRGRLAHPAPEQHRRGGVPKWLRERSAKPPFTGSNPVAASKTFEEPPGDVEWAKLAGSS